MPRVERTPIELIFHAANTVHATGALTIVHIVCATLDTQLFTERRIQYSAGATDVTYGDTQRRSFVF